MLALRRPLRSDQPLTRVRVAAFEHTLKLGRINDTDQAQQLRARAEPSAGTLDRVGVILNRERSVGRPLRKQPDTDIDRRRIEITNNRSCDSRSCSALRSDGRDGETHT